MTLSLTLTIALFAAAPPTRIDCDRVTVLLGLLDEDEFTARKNADNELRRMGKGVLPYLREEQLRSRSLEVRSRLAAIARDLSADDAVPDLVRQLTHADDAHRRHAAFALGKLTADQLPALEAELLRGTSPQATQVLKQVIAELRSPR